MDQAIRNSLQNATQQARRLLEQDIAEQLEGTFDVMADGAIADKPGKHLDATQRLVRTKLVEAIRHRADGSTKADKLADAVSDYIREAAFTILNRYIALKMLEVRGLVQQCISKGDQSSGFKEFCLAAPGLAMLPDKGYRLYLECLFDELSIEVKILFDRHDHASLLWPRRQVLEALLAILNAEDIAGVWKEDETLGWLYQYFNSRQEIDELRKASEAPRNSRELAVRNQFFTPRYIVEFLTDNTLGRTWHEMRQGDTKLVEKCRYLIRRPDEVFLADAQSEDVKAAAQWLQGQSEKEPDIWSLAHTVNGYQRAGLAGEESNAWVEKRLPKLRTRASAAELRTQEVLDLLFLFCRKERFCEGTLASLQSEIDQAFVVLRERVSALKKEDAGHEEVLRQPLFIQFRAKKDPRDLKILDPACGSSHFLLYCFDLLLIIYEEAWHDEESPASEIAGKTIRKDYETIEALRAAVPALILCHNLYGIDIDPRCAQIGAFALWMRTQRAYHEFKLPKYERPAITRSNIAVAEPMPGDPTLLKEFTRTLQPAILGQLIQVVFDKMQLASEAGSLLRIEEELKDAISVARTEWIRGPRHEQSLLFGPAEKPAEQLRFDMSGINDGQFWHEAESRTLVALKAFSGAEPNGSGFRRRLFADDAAAGFAFIDICRLRFDVALMNPPFGDASLPSKPYIEETYGDTKGDVFKTFVECFQDRLVPAGYLGIISSRTGFFLPTAEDWRVRILLRLYRLSVMADLGYGVLDAKVETAAYVLRSLNIPEDDALTASLVPALANIPVDASGYFSVPKYQKHRGGLKRHQVVGELDRLLRCGAVRTVEGSFARFAILPKRIPGKTSCTQCADASGQVGVFIRVLRESDKQSPLGLVIALLRDGMRDGRCFATKLSSFCSIPGTPFAYWVTENIRQLYCNTPKFELAGRRTVKQGLATADDFRFLRLWWEVPAEKLLDAAGGPPWHSDVEEFQDWCRDRTISEQGWVPLAKGGQYTPFYADITLVLNWRRDGEELAAFEGSVIRNREYYFRPGLTYLSRTSLRLCATPLPAGCVFSHVGPAILPEVTSLIPSLARFNSYAVEACISPFHARGTEGDDQTKKYEVGLLQAVPWPPMRAALEPLTTDVLSAFQLRTSKDETARSFACDNWGNDPTELLLSNIFELESLVASDYGLSMDAAFSAATGESGPGEDIQVDLRNGIRVGLDWPSNLDQIIRRLQYAVGCVFGRWDVRLATGEKAIPSLPNPFDPLPICPPGMLAGDDELPALRPPPDYPIRVRADGIAVDDEGHPADLFELMKSVLSTILKTESDSWLVSVVTTLGCDGSTSTDLRPWMRREFFGEHCKRYKKTPRKAPIYWQLSVPSLEYSVWLYYPRLSSDMLFRVLNDFVKPKIRDEQLGLERVRQETGDSPTRTQRDVLDKQEQLVFELQSFQETLEILAPLWGPDLDDGVLINFSPLWRLVPHSKGWQKDCKACWDALCVGELDWAHLAMRLWPERVVPKCVDDASLAIAHGLKETFWEKNAKGRWVKKNPPADAGKGGWQLIISRLVAERTNRQVKDALVKLLAAPTRDGGNKRGRAKAAKASTSVDEVPTVAGRKRKTKGVRVRDEAEELF